MTIMKSSTKLKQSKTFENPGLTQEYTDKPNKSREDFFHLLRLKLGLGGFFQCPFPSKKLSGIFPECVAKGLEVWGLELCSPSVARTTANDSQHVRNEVAKPHHLGGTHKM